MYARIVFLPAVLVIATSFALGAQPDPDTKELLEYRLTLDTLRKVDAANRALIQKLQKDPKYQAQMKLQRELETLQQRDDLTDEEMDRMEEIEDQMDEMREREFGMEDDETETLADMEARISKFAPLASAIRDAGLTPREYAKFQLSLFQALFAYGLQKSGALKELPKEVPAENVQFVQEHEAEIARLAKEWEQLGGVTR